MVGKSKKGPAADLAAFNEPRLKKAAAALPNPKKPKIKTEDLPVVEEWVLASEAAELAGVSRQYLHSCAGDFESSSQLSGFLAFRRAEILQWAHDRNAKFAES